MQSGEGKSYRRAQGSTERKLATEWRYVVPCNVYI